MVFVVVIVVAWIIILGPNLLRRRSRVVDGINSISHFHRQLRILEHSAPPPIVTPAFRLRSVDGSEVSESASGASGVVTPKLTVVGADQLPKPALAFLGRPATDETEDQDSGDGVTVARPPSVAAHESVPPSVTTPVDPHVRQLTLRRRRDALGVLCCLFVGTLLIGFIPGASPAWFVTLIAGVALAAYVGLLVRMRRLADERQRKLHYLYPGAGEGNGPTDPGHSSALGGPSVRVSGRYAHPSSQAAAAR